ncbi:MAG: DMT family transporter [Acidimicrobiales bacterium]
MTSLLAVTIVWGSTFVIVKNAISHMAVMDFLAWRFAVATVVMIAVRPRCLGRLSRRGWVQGALLGIVLGAGYVTQTFGLEHTSAAVSGFLTGMFVVFTPLLSGLFLKRQVSLGAWLATAVATGGLAVISLSGFGIGEGELLTVACAFFYAVQIVALGEWSADHDPYALCVVQLLTATICCLVAAAPAGLTPPPSASVWLAIGMTAILATAVAFLIQTWAQARIAPTRAAIVLTMEPVFAGITAALAGEHLGWRVLVGGGMVLAAMYVVELSPGTRTSAPADAGVALPDQRATRGPASS